MRYCRGRDIVSCRTSILACCPAWPARWSPGSPQLPAPQPRIAALLATDPTQPTSYKSPGLTVADGITATDRHRGRDSFGHPGGPILTPGSTLRQVIA